MEMKSDINIQHPEAWELLVSINDRQVDYILYTPAVANSLVIGHVDIADDSLQALEDAIYETPELLNEYKRVRVVVHSSHFVLLPRETEDDDCEMLVRQAFPNDDGDAAVCVMPGNEVKIAYLMRRGMQAFLGRTFNYPTALHHLLPLCEHFMELGKGDDASRMFLNLNPESMDVAIYSKGQLSCANSYAFTNVEDAAYYIMNMWRAFDLDQLTDELQLMGDNDMQSSIMPMLREYVKYVMPAVYPAAAMKLGRNAMLAPLELILMALCE